MGDYLISKFFLRFTSKYGGKGLKIIDSLKRDPTQIFDDSFRREEDRHRDSELWRAAKIEVRR